MATLNGDRKKYAFGEEAQSKLNEGIKKGFDVVASTLGSCGRNIMIDRRNRTPHVVDDGKSAIDNLILEDELENLGVLSLVDAAGKASEYAGDGTSTTIVLTKAFYEAGKKLVGGGLAVGKTPLEIKNLIKSGSEEIISKLKERSFEIKDKEAIKKVAISAYADEKMADVIADMAEKIGENGIMIVEEGWGRETETEILTGMRFAGKLAHELFSNTPERGLNLEGFPVLVSDFDFVNLDELLPIVKDLLSKNSNGLIVVANKYERQAIEQVIKTNLFNLQNRIPFKIYLVKTPSFTPDEFEDLAVFLGAKYFSKEKGEKIMDCKVENLGTSSEFKISISGDGIAIGGAGKKEDVDKRIEFVKQRLADEKVKMLKGRLEQRIASLASAIGIIKVASPSEG